MTNNSSSVDRFFYTASERALDRELDLIGTSLENFDSPQDALNFIIDWHVDVATNPKTNGGYTLIQVPEYFPIG